MRIYGAGGQFKCVWSCCINSINYAHMVVVCRATSKRLVEIVTIIHPEIVVGSNGCWSGGRSTEHIGEWIAQLQKIVGCFGLCSRSWDTAKHIDDIGAGAGGR